MACRTLLRRRTQLALLRSACDRGAPALVSLRGQGTIRGEARLVALERDGVLLAWSRKWVAEAEVGERPVEVRFEHEGEHYVFHAVPRGRAGRDQADDEARSILRLSLPLRLERGRRREHLRLAAAELPHIVGRFTHVIDNRRQFEARLTDIGDGGVGVTVGAADVDRLHTGDLFWLEMELPGEKESCEFVVRLVHLRPVKNSDELTVGWAFQPSDDAAAHGKYLRRLESFMSRRQLPGSVGAVG